MGRTTFEPALTNDRWTWPDLDVFVLGSEVPTAGAPAQIVTDDDPRRLLDKLRAASRGGDVHIVLPILLGDGMRLTPALSTDTRLTLETERPLPGGSVEIVYTCA